MFTAIGDDRVSVRKSLIGGIFVAIGNAGWIVSIAAVNRRVAGSNPA
jgi:hypothetical protein